MHSKYRKKGLIIFQIIIHIGLGHGTVFPVKLHTPPSLVFREMGVASWSALARRHLVGQGGLIAAGRAATASAAPHAPLGPPISARARWSSSRGLAIAAMFLALLLGAVLARCMLGLQGAPSYESSRTSFESFSHKDDFSPSNLIDSYQSPQNVLDDAAQVLHIPTRRELPLRRCLRLQPLPPSCRSTWSS